MTSIFAVPLSDADDCSAYSSFDCHYSDGYKVAPRLEGEVQDLCTFLHQRAKPALLGGYSVTYIVRKQDDNDLLGFFTLAASSIRFSDQAKNELIDKHELNEKDFSQFPAIKIAQLAVCSKYQGDKAEEYGKKVFESITTIACRSAKDIGIRYIIVDALADIRTVKFYNKLEFKPHYDDENIKAYTEILDRTYEAKQHKKLKLSISMYYNLAAKNS